MAVVSFPYFPITRPVRVAQLIEEEGVIFRVARVPRAAFKVAAKMEPIVKKNGGKIRRICT